jgi:translation initiation factor 3 subunit D
VPHYSSSHGFLYEYDKTYDRVNTKNEKPLQIIDRIRYNPTTSDDPIIQEVRSRFGCFSRTRIHEASPSTARSQGQGSDLRDRRHPLDAHVHDSLCLPLGYCPHSRGRQAFHGQARRRTLRCVCVSHCRFVRLLIFLPADYPSVNENASDPPLENDKDTLNSPSALSLEATYINQNFAFQVVREDTESRIELEHPNPFYSADEAEPLASCAYRYRKFDLSITEDEDVQIIVRTEVDSFVKATSPSDEDTFITIKTLNEFDSRAQGSGGAPDWRTKLDSQRGAVVATEMKNNSSKLARWAVQSILAGAEQMKMG